ncbi:MAG: hypothetical protein WBU92_01580 [Candidatus Dormiibacterota bacterium]
MARKTEIQPVEEAPVRYGEPEGGGCDHTGCTNTEAYRCLYRDRRAVDCAWVACKEHLRVVEGRAYCMRHAGIEEVLALARKQGQDLLPPDLDDRCASLVRAVANDLSEPVLERLVRWSDANTSIINDPAIRYTRPDRAHRVPGHWERVWALATRTGLLLRVGVRVEDTRPETVILTGGITHLVATVPPWIQRRLRGDQYPGSQSELVERLAFQQQLLQALDSHVEKYGVAYPRSLSSAPL